MGVYLRELFRRVVALLMDLGAWECPDCGGKVFYAGDDYMDGTWVSVYECSECGGQFV